jgi:hypothetical protein
MHMNQKNPHVYVLGFLSGVAACIYLDYWYRRNRRPADLILIPGGKKEETDVRPGPFSISGPGPGPSADAFRAARSGPGSHTPQSAAFAESSPENLPAMDLVFIGRGADVRNPRIRRQKISRKGKTRK